MSELDGGIWNHNYTFAPPDPPSDESLDFKIPAPDSQTTVPDASTIVLACFGALQMFVVRKKVFR